MQTKLSMRHLTGKNIRSGIELEVPIEDIFTPDAESTGDIRAKIFFEKENNNEKQDADFLKLIKEHELIEYKEFLVEKNLNPTLKVAVYNEYHLTYNRFSNQKFQCVVITELIFYNTEELSFEDFCFNFMTAQAFSGNFPQLNFQHHFTGIGKFDINSAAAIFPLAIAGNLSLEFFFIYYKGILASIENIITGSIDKDLEAQKEYVEKDAYNLIKNDLKEHQEEIKKILDKKAQI